MRSYFYCLLRSPFMLTPIWYRPPSEIICYLTGMRWNLEERVGMEGPTFLRTFPFTDTNVCGLLNAFWHDRLISINLHFIRFRWRTWCDICIYGKMTITVSLVNIRHLGGSFRRINAPWSWSVTTLFQTLISLRYIRIFWIFKILTRGTGRSSNSAGLERRKVGVQRWKGVVS